MINKRVLYEDLNHLICSSFSRLSTKKKIAISYGGAFSGIKGGPQVKIGLLQNKFPEHRFFFNLVYLVSGALYLNKRTIDFLSDKKIPIVLNQNGVGYPAWTKDWETINKRMSHAHAAANHIFYQSEFCKRNAEKYLGTTNGQSEILYNGVDTDFFTPGTQENQKKESFKLLMTGHMRQSSMGVLKRTIEAISIANKRGICVALQVAGFIPDDIKTVIYSFIDDMNVRSFIDLTGPYTRLEAPTLLGSADGFVSLKYNDPCPNSILEALSCGLPVLYSKSGGTPELVGEKSGIGLNVPESYEDFFYPEPSDIADGILNLFERKEIFSVEARNRAVQMFSLTNWLHRHEKIFMNLLQEK